MFKKIKNWVDQKIMQEPLSYEDKNRPVEEKLIDVLIKAHNTILTINPTKKQEKSLPKEQILRELGQDFLSLINEKFQIDNDPAQQALDQQKKILAYEYIYRDLKRNYQASVGRQSSSESFSSASSIDVVFHEILSQLNAHAKGENAQNCLDQWVKQMNQSTSLLDQQKAWELIKSVLSVPSSKEEKQMLVSFMQQAMQSNTQSVKLSDWEKQMQSIMTQSQLKNYNTFGQPLESLSYMIIKIQENLDKQSKLNDLSPLSTLEKIKRNRQQTNTFDHHETVKQVHEEKMGKVNPTIK